jgi:hypothetical protein
MAAQALNITDPEAALHDGFRRRMGSGDEGGVAEALRLPAGNPDGGFPVA